MGIECSWDIGAYHHATTVDSIERWHSDESNLARSLRQLIICIEGSLSRSSARSCLVESGHGPASSVPHSGTIADVADSDRLKNGTIAKLAMKVSEYYGEALRFAVAAKGAGGVWPLFAFPSVSIFATRKGAGTNDRRVGIDKSSHDQTTAF